MERFRGAEGSGWNCISAEVHLTVGDTGGGVSRTNNGGKWFLF
jgi:hypothetical protein